MIRVALGLLAAVALFGQAHAVPVAADADEDESFLKARHVPVDGPGLLDYFRSRIPTTAKQQQAAALVRQLADDNYSVREKATLELIRLGTPARAELKQAAQHPDLEVRTRATRCLTAIQTEDPAAVAAAAARLLRRTRPAGAAAVLVDFLPFAGGEEVEEEVFATLGQLTAQAGTPEPGLVKLLGDHQPLKRAAAALLLARHGNAGQKQAAHARLVDADARVRFRAAQGTLAARDRSALPVLIALLEETEGDLGQHAEDLLYRAAGEKSPADGLGSDPAARKQVRAAWASWWKAQENSLDLSRANVELFLVNPAVQARRVAEQFLNAYLKNDAVGLRRTVNVPFVMSFDDKNLRTREDVVKFFVEIGKEVRQREKVKFTVGNVSAIDAFFKNGGSVPGGDAKAKQDLLRKPGTLAVLVNVNEGGRDEKVWLFVRMSGGRSYVIGVGEGRNGK